MVFHYSSLFKIVPNRLLEFRDFVISRNRSKIAQDCAISRILRNPAKSVEKNMYMTKYEVFCTVFENCINNITILTTENCTGAIKNTIFSSSMSIALDAIFFFIN